MKKILARIFGSRIRGTLERSEGGIFKRIDENRELAQLLVRSAPQLLKEYPDVMAWLKSQDHFLSELAECPVYKPECCLFKARKGLPRRFVFDGKYARTKTAQTPKTLRQDGE